MVYPNKIPLFAMPHCYQQLLTGAEFFSHILGTSPSKCDALEMGISISSYLQNMAEYRALQQNESQNQNIFGLCIAIQGTLFTPCDDL